MSWLAGSWFVHQLTALPSTVGLLWISLSAALAAVMSCRRPARLLSRMVAAASLATVWTTLLARQQLKDALPEHVEGRTIEFEGDIVDLPQRFRHGLRFLVEPTLEARQTLGLPSRLQLSQFSRHPQAKNVFQVGERWRFRGSLKRPYGYSNPHGFDLERALWSTRVQAVGKLVQGSQRLLAEAPGWYLALQRLRSVARLRLQQRLVHSAAADVIIALAIGDQSGISAEQWRLFRNTGITHLVSISGLHITMFAWLLGGLCRMGWRCSARLCLWRPAQQIGLCGGVAAAGLYTSFSGADIPAQRTFLMLLIISVSLWAGGTLSPARLLATAAWMLILIDPWAWMHTGFWLSFGAVAVLLWTSAGRLQPTLGWRGWLTAQWALFIGLMPAMALWFGQSPLLAPLANAVAVPLISLIIAPLAVAGTLFGPAATLAGCLMSYLITGLEIFNRWPHMYLVLPAPTALTLSLGVAGIALALAPRGWPGRYLALLLCLPLVWRPANRPATGSFRATILDVGQGLSVHVQTAQHDLLFDAGPGNSISEGAGAQIVVPYLRGSGVRRLHGVVISHNDQDHSGGLAAVTASFPISWLRAGVPSGDPFLDQTPRAKPCVDGERWRWDGVLFEMLNPSAPQMQQPHRRKNERSCVLRISSVFGSLLLPGDIEAGGESEQRRRSGQQLKSCIVVAPHHGSKTSSTAAWLAAVQPKAVVFSAGKNNRYGHPHPSVVERYRLIGAHRFRTDEQGALILDFDAKQISVSSWRQAHARYWHRLQPFSPSPSEISCPSELPR